METKTGAAGAGGSGGAGGSYPPPLGGIIGGAADEINSLREANKSALAIIEQLKADKAKANEEIARLVRRVNEETKYKEQARGEAEAYMTVVEKLIDKLRE